MIGLRYLGSRRLRVDTPLSAETVRVMPIKAATLLAALSAALGAVLILATAASADLPKKPACSDVSYATVDSTFGSAETITQATTGTNLFHTSMLNCNYCNPGCKTNEGQQIQYDHGTVGEIRAFYNYMLKQVKKGGPVSKVGGVGDAAFTQSDGIRLLVFRSGHDIVFIKGGDRQTAPTLQAFETLAKYIIRNG